MAAPLSTIRANVLGVSAVEQGFVEFVLRGHGADLPARNCTDMVMLTVPLAHAAIDDFILVTMQTNSQQLSHALLDSMTPLVGYD